MRHSASKMATEEHRSYYVYVLLCDDGSYYTGYTSNPTVRLIEHVKGYGARYTKMRRPNRIVYFEKVKTRRAAMRRERKIKTLTHEEKRSLAERASVAANQRQVK
jgi:putative endonuclease